ncbi:hypothetical protein D8B35_06610 [Lactococcus laudensis]|nr:hypothetical protein [Lactococcus laudensis]
MGTSKNSNLPLLAKFTYRVVIAPHLTAVSFVAMPSARKIYLKSYQKQFLEVPLSFNDAIINFRCFTINQIIDN